MPRTLDKKEIATEEETNEKIMVISTYGRDNQLMKPIKQLSDYCDKLKFNYVKKAGPSLKNILSKSKSTALGDPFGPTLPCSRTRCKSCQQMSAKDNITLNQSSKRVKTAGGSCISSMLIYHAECGVCSKKYVGKTIQRLVERINGHRAKFYYCLKGNVKDKNNSEYDYVLGRHLVLCHGLRVRDLLILIIDLRF